MKSKLGARISTIFFSQLDFADFIDAMYQKDTYFLLGASRLKLREQFVEKILLKIKRPLNLFFTKGLILRVRENQNILD